MAGNGRDLARPYFPPRLSGGLSGFSRGFFTDTPAAQKFLHGAAVIRVGDNAVEVDIVWRFREIAGRRPVFMRCQAAGGYCHGYHGNRLAEDYGRISAVLRQYCGNDRRLTC
jgi:hypothetical protein